MVRDICGVKTNSLSGALPKKVYRKEKDLPIIRSLLLTFSLVQIAVCSLRSETVNSLMHATDSGLSLNRYTSTVQSSCRFLVLSLA